MSETLTCICCGRDLHNITQNGFQPNDGLAFVTSGHYGSTYFDPMDGSWLQIAICDDCVKRADDRGITRRGPPRRPTQAARSALDELLVEDDPL